jgi:hypothetical protein
MISLQRLKGLSYMLFWHVGYTSKVNLAFYSKDIMRQVAGNKPAHEKRRAAAGKRTKMDGLLEKNLLPIQLLSCIFERERPFYHSEGKRMDA